MSDTCRLFPPFGDPWLSCLLHSQKDPQMSQSTPEDHDFPALHRLSHRVLTHTKVACVTALWESLEGLPQTPLSTLWEA